MIHGHRYRVLLVGDTLNVGGSEGQLAEVACRLDRSRWDVHVTCLNATGPLRAKLEAAGVPPRSCHSGSFESPKVVVAAVRLARYIRANEVRVVHCFGFYSNVLGVTAGRLARAPVVIASQRDLGNLHRPREQKLNWLMLRRAHRVLANSRAAAEVVHRYAGVSFDRIALIPSGVDVARFTPALGAGPPADGLVIGTLANLRHEKGLADLIRAASLVRDRCPATRFVIWGDGPFRGELETLVADLRLTDTVSLPGKTAAPHTELRRMHAFVLPSTSGACSNALLEAMASGLPVVASRVGGNVEVLAHGEAGRLVPPGDPNALAKAVIDVVEDERLRLSLGARSRARAVAEFTIDRMLMQIEALYVSALGGGR